MDPTALLSSLNNVKKIVDYGFSLKSVSDESQSAKQILRLVSNDLNELKRLAVQLEDHLDTNTKKSVDSVICQTNEVIALMAAPNRRSIKDVEQFGTVTIYRRIMWTIRDGDAIKAHMPHLQMCQSSLHSWTQRLADVRRDLGRYTLGPRLNVWDDISTVAPGSTSGLRRYPSGRSEALRSEDLSNENLWDDWFRNDRQNSTKNSKLDSEPVQDLAWLGEHADSEFAGHKYQSTVPDIVLPSDNSQDLSGLVDDFEKAEEDDRRYRNG